MESSSPAVPHARRSATVDVALPIAFVFLWSTGYIGSKVGTLATEPMTFLAIRLLVPCLLLPVVIAASGAPWPGSLAQVGHIALVGVLIHAVCFGGALVALTLGVQAGVVALIAGVNPLMVTLGAGLFFHERVSRYHGLGLGLGIAGVVLVVWHKLQLGIGTVEGFVAATLALLGLCAGTLYQKRFCAGMDLRTGALIQHVAACLLAAVAALAFEDRVVRWSATLVLTLAWMGLVLSFGAISIFYVLLRRGAATKVSGLFFLMPPTTAAMGWIFFGEVFQPLGLLGMLLTVAGVAMINLDDARPAPSPAAAAGAAGAGGDKLTA